jgi:hypothetical protein
MTLFPMCSFHTTLPREMQVTPLKGKWFERCDCLLSASGYAPLIVYDGRQSSPLLEQPSKQNHILSCFNTAYHQIISAIETSIMSDQPIMRGRGASLSHLAYQSLIGSSAPERHRRKGRKVRHNPQLDYGEELARARGFSSQGKIRKVESDGQPLTLIVQKSVPHTSLSQASRPSCPPSAPRLL